MDVSWTFGSVGDLIAICQLVGQALGTGHGSSTREYRELRKELDNLVHILTLVGYSKFHRPALLGSRYRTSSFLTTAWTY